MSHPRSDRRRLLHRLRHRHRDRLVPRSDELTPLIISRRNGRRQFGVCLRQLSLDLQALPLLVHKRCVRLSRGQVGICRRRIRRSDCRAGLVLTSLSRLTHALQVVALLLKGRHQSGHLVGIGATTSPAHNLGVCACLCLLHLGGCTRQCLLRVGGTREGLLQLIRYSLLGRARRLGHRLGRARRLGHCHGHRLCHGLLHVGHRPGLHCLSLGGCGTSLRLGGCGTSLRLGGCGTSLRLGGCGTSLCLGGCGTSLRRRLLLGRRGLHLRHLCRRSHLCLRRPRLGRRDGRRHLLAPADNRPTVLTLLCDDWWRHTGKACRRRDDRRERLRGIA